MVEKIITSLPFHKTFYSYKIILSYYSVSAVILVILVKSCEIYVGIIGEWLFVLGSTAVSVVLYVWNRHTFHNQNCLKEPKIQNFINIFSFVALFTRHRIYSLLLVERGVTKLILNTCTTYGNACKWRMYLTNAILHTPT